ncbi:MAG: hypothetical protein KME16_09420 [Scytolyngbya sp. HA4215-MV1]|jgi:hypothetical protein|nr:hypothetical protein [Scytolyngbya sp. HA4215-MV1]
MIKKFGDYQIQVGELYSGPNDYRVLIDISSVTSLPSAEIRGKSLKVKNLPFNSPQDVLSISVCWKTLSFLPSSSADFWFTDSKQFYSNLLMIVEKIQSKSYLNKEAQAWWEFVLKPLEGQYIYLGKLDDINISISKKDQEECLIGDDTFLPTEVLIKLIRRISKDSHPDR